MICVSKAIRLSVAAFVVVHVALTISPARAQVSPEEHAKHHPDQAQGSGTQGDGEKGGGMMGGDGGGMMGGKGGGMMGGGMGGMMEKMGAPKPKELYPKLMDLPDLPMEERTKIRQEAHQRMLDGTTQLSGGLDELAAAAGTDDFQTMQNATAKMREGLAQFESGLAAHRAIAEGKAPRNVALQWFRREMNLLPAASSDAGFRFLGMTAFHTAIMAVLIAFAAAMIWMYFFKMKRATELMTQLASATPSVDDPVVERPTASDSAASVLAASRASTPVAAAVPASASQGAVAQHDCCSDSDVACPDEASVADEGISTGLLRVAKRKLCRLRVARIFQETDDVKTFRLVACHGGALPFNYLPGQFLTLTLPVGEKPIRRSYTISSTPTQGYYCEITVKREDQGAGSRYLHDSVKEGDTLDVQAPSGKFIFTGTEADSIVLIAGGVGITPMMSITRALTDMGWQGEIYFVAACRDPEHFIFQEELRQLQQRNANLHVYVAMSRIKDPIDGYYTGRLSKERLAEWVPDIASKWVHLCGAPPMMDATKQMLAELGVPAEKIHTENFGSQQKPHVKAAAREQAAESTSVQQSQGEAAAAVTFATSGKTTSLPPDETVLDAAEREGIDIDYSCRVGMCGVCQVKLLAGKVTMEVDDGLEPEDKASGMILACQATSTEDITVEA